MLISDTYLGSYLVLRFTFDFDIDSNDDNCHTKIQINTIAH